MKKFEILPRMKRKWIYLLLGTCCIVAVYNLLENMPSFFSDGYEKYKIQELELQNNLLLSQLGQTREKMNFLITGNSDRPPPEDILCDIPHPVQKCETIHVAIVCAEYKTTRMLITMLKSIIFYRQNPLHLHILVDETAQKILDKLFETWAIPLVNVSLYRASDAIPSVSWVPNFHYSGVYGLLKLTLPKVLPQNITRIIVLDTDLTFTADIADLWALFTRFDKNQAIGLVENQSGWYLGRFKQHSKPWPAIAKGFNSGVILMNLKQLSKIDWPNVWKSVTEKTLVTHKSTALADQDIFNAVIKKYPELVYPLPCEWNIQLGDATLSAKCYESFPIKVIHWNSPRKIGVKNKNIEYFRNIYYTFLEYNGNMLRRKLDGCSPIISDEMIENGECSKIEKFKHTKWRTHIFLREYKYNRPTDGADVTLLVDLPFNRLPAIERLAKYWTGPMSVIIYATDFESAKSVEFIENSEVLKHLFNIAYHVVYRDEPFYPVSEMRNIGLKYVDTEYVFLTNINYIPMFDLYLYLLNTISELQGTLESMAVIIPSVEQARYNATIPKSKSEVLQMMDKNHINFVSDGESTNSAKWKTATEPYQVKIGAESVSGMMVHKSVPKYDRNLVDPVWAPIAHTLVLQSRKYTFQTLAEAFIIRLPTEFSTFRYSYTQISPQFQKCLKQQKEEFISKLSKVDGRIPEESSKNK